MKPELYYLTLVVVFTGLMWVPYILDRIVVRGLIPAMGYESNPKPQSFWAQRLMKAHVNAVENLAVFAPLVLVANVAGISSSAIVTAAMVYFWTRIVHAVAYTFAVPYLRTLAFAAGVCAQATVALSLLTH